MCAGPSKASHRVELITEQMSAWRERRQRWQQQQQRQQQPLVYSEEAVASSAGPAAAVEVLDALVALLCGAAEHERLTEAVGGGGGAAAAAAAKRRPTMYTAGSVGTLIGLVLQALSEILGQASAASGARSGGGTSTRSGFLTRGKKRRGSASSSPGGGGGDAGAASSPAAPSKWTSLMGQQVMYCLDRVHLAGLLLAWESCHPWIERDFPTAAASSSGAAAGRLSLKQSRSWQTFCSLMGLLAQACVSPRPPPPSGQGLAALVTQAALSFRATSRSSSDALPFLDMPAVLLLCKVRRPGS